jgi:imidazolonepropionase-like amidohydrolase
MQASRTVEAMIGVDDFGTIELGKRADLILVEGNPLEDVARVRIPLGVVAAGRWYTKQTLEPWLALYE